MEREKAKGSGGCPKDAYVSMIQSEIADSDVNLFIQGLQKLQSEKAKRHENTSKETTEDEADKFFASGESLEYLFYMQLSNFTNDSSAVDVFSEIMRKHHAESAETLESFDTAHLLDTQLPTHSLPSRNPTADDSACMNQNSMRCKSHSKQAYDDYSRQILDGPLRDGAPHYVAEEYTNALSMLSAQAIEKFDSGEACAPHCEEKIRSTTLDLWLKRVHEYSESSMIENCCLCEASLPHWECIKVAAKLPLPLSMELRNALQNDIRMHLKRSIWRKEKTQKKRLKRSQSDSGEGSHTVSLEGPTPLSPADLMPIHTDLATLSSSSSEMVRQGIASEAELPASPEASHGTNLKLMEGESCLEKDRESEAAAEDWVAAFLGKDALVAAQKYHTSPMSGICWNHGCWRVSICKNGLKQYQYFSIHKFGFFNALKRSIEHRLEHEKSMLRQKATRTHTHHPKSVASVSNQSPSMENQQKKKAKRKHNGVYSVEGISLNESTRCWNASWVENGKTMTKSFAMAEFGEDAFTKAVKFRTECLRRLYAREELCDFLPKTATGQRLLSLANSTKDSVRLHNFFLNEQKAIKEQFHNIFGPFRILRWNHQISWTHMGEFEDITNATLAKCVQYPSLSHAPQTMLNKDTLSLSSESLLLSKMRSSDSSVTLDLHSLEALCKLLIQPHPHIGPYGLYVPRATSFSAEPNNSENEAAREKGTVLPLSRYVLCSNHSSFWKDAFCTFGDSNICSLAENTKTSIFKIPCHLERILYNSVVSESFEDVWFPNEQFTLSSSLESLIDVLRYFPSWKNCLSVYTAKNGGMERVFWCASFIEDEALPHKWKRYFNINFFGYYKSLFMAAEYLRVMKMHSLKLNDRSSCNNR